MPWRESGYAGSEDLHAVRFGNGIFAAVGAAGTVQVSPNGAEWAAAALPAEAEEADLLGLAFGGGTFVAVGKGGTVLRSADGLAWEISHPGGGTADLHGVRYLNDRFFAFGDEGRMLSSDAGATWAEMPSVAAGVSIWDLAWADGAFWAVAEEGVYRSADGARWIRRNAGPVGLSPAEAGPAGCVYNQGTLFISGQSGQILALPLEAPGARIVRQPADLVATEGETVEFAVGAEGVDLTYAWHFDGAPLHDGAGIEGSGTAALRLTDVGPARAGVYSVSVSGAMSTPAYLTVKTYEERQSYEAFVYSRFPDGDRAISERAGPLADADGDDVANLLEYALGGDPLLPDRQIPVVALERREDGSYVALTFYRLRNAVDIGYVIEQSADLVTWGEINGPFEEETEALSGALEAVTVRQRVPADGLSRHYVRLRVTAVE